jgi:hypothetical protein
VRRSFLMLLRRREEGERWADVVFIEEWVDY